ncbi:MAG: DUF721 domain-containing protein [Burkholderia sp.]|nr:DUF721 domain-containing protein [Burkholderia sp.]
MGKSLMRQFNQSSLPSRLPQILTAFEMLKNTKEFTDIYVSVQQLAALQRDLSKFLPDYIMQQIKSGFINHGILKLFTTHNALASRLWQIKPRLLDNLQQNGWSVISIKIHIRPKVSEGVRRLKKAQITNFGISVLQELTQNLKPSPLQEALSRMIAHHTKITF